MEYKEEYKKWTEDVFFDEKTRQELLEIQDEGDIEDRFYKTLEFGTAGIRGIMGAGINRMNEYTVSKATQGLANFIIKENAMERGVVIAYDSRNNSIEFSEIAANTLNANGIKTYVFDYLRPTPELSFAVRKLHAIAGIVITASHNPSKYNGYKVYWEDGAQIVAPKDVQIIEEVNKIATFEEVKRMDKNKAIEEGLYNVIGEEIDSQYIEELKKLILHKEVIDEVASEMKIVYTPLHGTGTVFVKRVLNELGFQNVYVVPEQEKPDGNFPTVEYPNPEEHQAFKMALDLAKEKDADLVLATDPDADRLGVYAKDTKTGEYISFTGNMSGLLIAEYILSQKKELGILPENGVLITTIVSSNLARPITQNYGIAMLEVFTGFKFIGEKIKQFEETKEHTYLFGFEESYGCLIGDYARDKDAISAVIALCEAAAYYKTKGLTLWEQMLNIYAKYGYYKEGIITISLEGASGAEKMQEIMDSLRENPVTEVGEYRALSVRDYNCGEITNLETGEKTKTSLPESNVIYYELENEAWACIRPSGTEAKIKVYSGVKGTNLEEAEQKLELLEQEVKKWFE